jgi:hypothetical protein
MPSVDLRLCRYFPAGRGSNSRPRRPDPAFAYPLACPVSRDTSNPTIPAQPSPRACTHVDSAPNWTYCHGKACLPRAPADAGGCGSAFTHLRRARKGPPVAAHCSHCGGPAPEARGSRGAPAAERAWPVLSVAVRQPIPTLAGVCAWRVAWVQCAAYTPLGMYHPGARSTHRPQAVVIPRLSHLGWPRMRGVASVCSHYARIDSQPPRFASVHIDHSQWISSARPPPWDASWGMQAG